MYQPKAEVLPVITKKVTMSSMMWANIPYIVMFSIGQKNHPCTYTNDFKGMILVTFKNTNTVQINHFK